MGTESAKGDRNLEDVVSILNGTMIATKDVAILRVLAVKVISRPLSMVTNTPIIQDGPREEWGKTITIKTMITKPKAKGNRGVKLAEMGGVVDLRILSRSPLR